MSTASPNLLLAHTNLPTSPSTQSYLSHCGTPSFLYTCLGLPLNLERRLSRPPLSWSSLNLCLRKYFYIFQLTIPHIMATLFWCKLFKTPELPSKHHIVGYEPIIDSHPIKEGVPVTDNSESPVHHMVLYECEVQEDDQVRI